MAKNIACEFHDSRVLFFRNLKKAELQMKVADDALEQVKLVYAKVKSQLDMAPKDDGTLFQKRKELQKEVDLAKKTLAQQVRNQFL
jgi:hypothetical protein